MQDFIENQWSCYILKSLDPNYHNRTYVGSTNSVKRRIRQHNREITGGAKITGIGLPYEFYCIITGFTDRISSLKCEWLIKHPTGRREKGNKKYSGVSGRIRGLNILLNSEKWKLKSNNCNITIWIKNDFAHYLDINNFPINVQVYLC